MDLNERTLDDESYTISDDQWARLMAASEKTGKTPDDLAQRCVDRHLNQLERDHPTFDAPER